MRVFWLERHEIQLFDWNTREVLKTIDLNQIIPEIDDVVFDKDGLPVSGWFCLGNTVSRNEIPGLHLFTVVKDTENPCPGKGWMVHLDLASREIVKTVPIGGEEFSWEDHFCILESSRTAWGINPLLDCFGLYNIDTGERVGEILFGVSD
jgi:hypothetical protein